MNFEIWHIWILSAIICFILEIFVPSFVIFNFGIGALVGAFAAIIGLSIEWQFFLFSVATLASFFLARPIMKRWFYKKSDPTKTNIEAYSGKIGIVSETINNVENKGRVTLDGDDWKARSENNDIIEKGTSVEIIKTESILLIVKSSLKN